MKSELFLKITAYVVIVVAVIGGFVYGQVPKELFGVLSKYETEFSFKMALPIWISGAVTASILFGLSAIINLLGDISYSVRRTKEETERSNKNHISA